ncbi:hypothetical protein N7468_006758 [Penicillium chermesinum]|uniref:Zn(2)-C6 fungal-type domain-containing protein n=1 Tax=Penicillium chermesinum TaxID=63820 RepID=A0A9W9NV92_9EURO|nr:uncharacterized protein N7468_006758 [Penicillium chermesinum]KAJ5225533.1 hypothetical protein N7468_006758 [Penicillium chermesinum]KAJ6161246.1 hypothetical protein N7470_004642 [Penicillium chermesinum]
MPSTKPTNAPVRVSASASSSSSSSSQKPTGVQKSGKPQEKGTKTHKRSRSGCYTCRLRRKKCDEGHPSCKACTNLSVKCEYKRPMWWGSPEQRRMQKERIKNKIKQTKTLERSGQHDGLRARVITSPDSDSDFMQDYHRPLAEKWDAYGPHFSTPGFVPITYSHYTPYEIDVRTERQTFVNDVPLRHDSSTSTFSAMGPPALHATLPTFPPEEIFTGEFVNPPQAFETATFPEHSVGLASSSLSANIPVDDYDRPLLDHFIDNVLGMIFPILEVHQRASARAQAILQSLETNKSYFHCCLSVAAIHLKTTTGLTGEQIDHDIMRHRYEAISQLCQSLNSDREHEQILDATLAMIFFHCSVGAPDDSLPDIPWSDHFQAVSNLVTKLDLTNAMIPYGAYMVPPFSMSLTSWIDILGATMLGRTPQFAHTYRTKHLSGTPSGLRELMGCDDRVMYLISEVACLESLKQENRVDSMALCTHVSDLGNQLDYTEPADPVLESPFSPNGSIRPEILTKNMTALFRLAARIYLCSLVPGADRSHTSTQNLVNGVTTALSYIPAGMFGYDRSLVWPLLITGVHSVPGSSFRQVLTDRTAAMGDHADLGSYGRMYQLLTEYWRLTDDPAGQPIASQCYISDPNATYAGPSSDLPMQPPLPSPGMREIKRQQVHWRDVMNRNGWRFLLI